MTDKPSGTTDDFLGAHAALAVAALSAVAILVRVLVVSAWQVPVAQAILASSPGPGLLLGTAVSLVPYASPLIAIGAWNVGRGRAPGSTERELWILLAIAATTVTVLVTPLSLIVVLAVGLGVSRLWRRRHHRLGLPGPTVVPIWKYVYLVAFSSPPVDVHAPHALARPRAHPHHPSRLCELCHGYLG